MPIPTRSQSVRTKTDVRRAEETKQDERPTSLKPQSGLPAAANGATRFRTATTQQLPYSRNATITSKPVASQITSNSTTAVASSKAGVVRDTRNVTAPKIANPTQSRQPSATLERRKISTTATGSTRTASSSTNGSRAISSNLSRPKAASNTRQPLKATKEAASQLHLTKSPVNDLNDSHSTESQLWDELLQLQLVYTPSVDNLARYQHDVESRIKKQRVELQQKEAQILEMEDAQQKSNSATALQAWLVEHTSRTDAQQIQVLSKAIADLTKYDPILTSLRPLREFESWLSEATSIRRDRVKVQHDGETQIRVVPSLGARWSEEMKSMQRKLSDIISVFRELHSTAADGSGVGGLIAGHLKYAESVFEEVSTALSIERLVIQSEQRWESEAVETALADLALAETSNTTARKCAWED